MPVPTPGARSNDAAVTPTSEETAAFPRLDVAQCAHLSEFARCTRFADGEALIERGSRDFPFYVVKSGAVEILEFSGDEPRLVATHGPGEFTGDVDLLTGRPAVISAVARGPVEAYQVEAKDLRTLLNELPALSDLLLEAFQMRRSILENSGFAGIRVVGSGNCAAANQIREFLYKNKVPHSFVDAELESERQWMAEHEVALDALPALVHDAGVVSRPTLEGIASCIGIRRDIQGKHFDLVVIGAGPAGLAAAVYGASEGLSTLVLDRMGPGGQAGTSSKIENYMGFPSGLSGADLANKGYLQALKFGAQFSAPVSVEKIVPRPAGGHTIHCSGEESLTSGAVIIATGASYRRLDATGCDRFRDAGVFSAATSVEARLCQRTRAVVIGGGNSAGQAAMFLADHAEGVVMLLRSGDLRKSMSDYLARRIELHDRIEVRMNSVLEEVEGTDRLERVIVRNRETDARETIESGAVFGFIGAHPHTEWLPAEIATDAHGFVLAGGDVRDRATSWPLEREPCQLETSVPGVFVAGDVRSGSTKRVAFAVGDGALAVTCVHQALAQV